ncbi:ANK [Mytilus edulis]|uniref:ANK n=1 Tax=Mytilus edulis TaxID=6550 RepID=A0A8S3TT62_MYTED|nr:ANK [Mytilus edulis]
MEGNAKILLEAGANVSFRGKPSDKAIGWIGCFCFAAMKCPSLIPDFLKYRADPNEVHEQSGKSVLLIAMDHKASKDDVIALIKAGASKGDSVKRPYNAVNHTVSCAYSVKQTVTELLSEGANPNMVPQGEDSPLIISVRKKMSDVVDMLIKHKANVNHLGKNGYTAIHVCCENVHDATSREISDILIEAGSDLNKPNDENVYPLESLLKCRPFANSYYSGSSLLSDGSSATIESFLSKMLENGVDPNCNRNSKSSPLVIAIERGLGNIVTLLIDKGANVLYTDGKGETPFTTCLKLTSTNRDDIMKALIDKEIPLNDLCSDGGYPLTLVLERKFDNSVVEMMLKKGANPNLVTPGKSSALMLAITDDRFNVSCDLMKTGADVNYTNDTGETVFGLFALKVKEKLGKQHLDKYRSTEITNNRSRTIVFKSFLEFGVEIDKPTKSKIHPLLVAVWLCNEEIVNTILERGTTVDDDRFVAILARAIRRDQTEIVKLMLKSRPCVNHKIELKRKKAIVDGGSSEKYTKISSSSSVVSESPTCSTNDTVLEMVLRDMPELSIDQKEQFVNLLLEYKADPNLVEDGRHSPLLQAVVLGAPKIVKALLDAKANVNHKGIENYTPLHAHFVVLIRNDRKATLIASNTNDQHLILDMLLQAGASLKSKTIYEEMPLHIALRCRIRNNQKYLDNIRALLNYSTDVNFPDKQKTYPLNVAAKCCTCDIIIKMMSLGADISSKDSDGNTALHCHMDATSFDKDVVSALLNSGAEINAVNNIGETVLMRHIRKSNRKSTPNTLQFLLDHGADPNICDTEGNSTLMEAINHDFYSAVSILVQHNANINHVGKDGNTALHLCLLKGPLQNDSAKDFKLNQFKELREELFEESGSANKVRKRSYLMDNSNKLAKISDISGVKKRRIVDSFGLNEPPLKAPKQSSSDETKEKEKDYNVNQNKETDDGNWELMKIIDFLLSHKANVNHNNEGCDSPLILAVRTENSEVVKRILKANPNMFYRGKDHLNAIDICLTVADDLRVTTIGPAFLKDGVLGRLANRRLECLNELFDEILITNICSRLLDSENTINVNFAKNEEDSPLIFFCKRRVVAVVEKLLGCNADVNYAGIGGSTVLHHVIDIHDETTAMSMLNCLLVVNPLLDRKDSKGQTALEKAIYVFCNNTNSYINGNDTRNNVLLTLMQRLLEAGAVTDHEKLGNVLMKCAQIGDFKTMESLFCHGADLNYRNILGQTVLHVCWSESLNGALDFLKFYVQKGGVLHNKDRNGNLPLTSLLKAKCNNERADTVEIAEIFQFMIKSSIKSIDDGDDPYLLHTAVRHGLIRTAIAILDAKECATVENKAHETPLYLATKAHNRKELIDLLLRNGADPNQHTSFKIPIVSAVKQCDVPTVSTLIKTGASINVKDKFGRSLLHVLYSDKSKKGDLCLMTKLLLEKGINVNGTDKVGRSALFTLLQYTPEENSFPSSSNKNKKDVLHSKETREDMVPVLVGNGLDVNLVDKCDNTALDGVCSSGINPKAGIALLNAGANPRSNCLEKAIVNFPMKNTVRVEFIDLLLLKGCDPNVFNGDSSNLIHVVSYGSRCLVESLLKHGSDVNFCDSRNKTALHFACELDRSNCRDDIVQLLIKNGANLNIQTTSGKRPLDILVTKMVKEVGYHTVSGVTERVIQIEVDLSSLNRLVCGGAQLCCIITTDSLDIENRHTFSSAYRRLLMARYGQKLTESSSLQNLIKHGFFKAAGCLIRCGWEFEKEKWFENFNFASMNLSNIDKAGESYKIIAMENATSELQTLMKSSQSVLKPLAHRCRVVIRKQLVKASVGSEIESKIEVLPVPTTIKSYLKFVDYCHNTEIFQLEKITRSLRDYGIPLNYLQSTFHNPFYVPTYTFDMDSDDGGISYEPDNDYYPESDDDYVYRHGGYRSDDEYSF